MHACKWVVGACVCVVSAYVCACVPACVCARACRSQQEDVKYPCSITFHYSPLSLGLALHLELASSL